MREHTADVPTASIVVWENLEEFVRLQVQRFIQRILEEEVTELLGRPTSARQNRVDHPVDPPVDPPGPEVSAAPGPSGTPVYRNGYGKPRQLTTGCGTVAVRRPRVRGLQARFESRILPLFRRRTRQIDRLLPELYLHGLSEGDFDVALRGLLGENAPLSASAIARLKAEWQQEYEAWKQRSLADLEVVYLWVDGVYVKAGLEKEKAALLVVLGALRDGRKVVLAVDCGARESTESWSRVLRELKARGLNAPKLVIGDGHLGIWGALANVFPEAGEQRCWNHRLLNVLDRLPKKQQPAAKVLLRQVMYAENQAEAERLKGVFQRWCEKQGQRAAGEALDEDWERLVTYYAFPRPHWKHLRTTNPVESPFATVRLRTTAAKRYKKAENATAVLWKTLLLAERSFRRLDAPELLTEVAAGVRFRDGERVRSYEKVAA
jgi:putative transposase